MATPPPPELTAEEEQMAKDALQDQNIEATQDNIRLLARMMVDQNIYVPPALLKKPPEEQPPEKAPEAPCFGNNGYRIFPLNGSWFSVRHPMNKYHRDELIKQGVAESEFYLKIVKDELGNISVKSVPYQEGESL